MNCALWLNRQKVYSADEICDNLDTASLLGYFAAGSLIEWLESHGGEDYAKKLAKLSPDDPKICEKIKAVFGGKPTAFRKLSSKSTEKSYSGGALSYPCSNSSYKKSSFRAGSGSLRTGSGILSLLSGSFTTTSGKFYNYIGSFYLGSFLFGSGFHEWEWEWEKYFGSFFRGSFKFGSGISARLAFLRSFGSFNFGSFRFGSFRGNSSFGKENLPDLPPFLKNLDEYDRIMMISLYGCPLNQFGYGIHNI